MLFTVQAGPIISTEEARAGKFFLFALLTVWELLLIMTLVIGCGTWCLGDFSVNEV